MRRTLAPWLAVSATLLVAGAIVYAITDGVAQAIGAGLIGLAAVLLMSCLFYAVGMSEENDRTRARR